MSIEKWEPFNSAPEQKREELLKYYYAWVNKLDEVLKGTKLSEKQRTQREALIGAAMESAAIVLNN